MFGTGNYATIWNVENKGNYSVVELSTSRKDKDSGEYKTDFSSKLVRFIGTAHDKAKHLARKDRIKIGNCGVTTRKFEDKWYTDFLVFSFDNEGEVATKNNSYEPEPIETVNEDDLPF